MGTATHPRRLAAIVAAALSALLLAAAPAHAENVGQKIIRLCTSGQSLAGYPPSAYAKALSEISATTEEYSECGQLIRAAEAAAARGGGSGGGGSGGSAGALATPVAATPAEQSAIARAQKSGNAPVSVGGQAIHPGVVHTDIASALSTLPTPLLVLLAFLLACLLGFGGRVLRDRIRGGRAG